MPIPRHRLIALWLHRQGLATPRGTAPTTRASLTGHLRRTGALQLDSINVLDRAHYLTLWSRLGPFDRSRIDRWVYRHRLGYEYWGHEASILPIDHLPLGRRRMRGFPPESWTSRSWWNVFRTSAASKRRVLKRLAAEGPLQSADFDRRDDEFGDGPRPGGSMPLSKEDTRSLKLLWHQGRVAVTTRRHFRIVYDLAERVYPDGPSASRTAYHDSWLLLGLSGNGIASERHLTGYLTAPAPSAAERRRIIARNLRQRRVVEVRVEGSSQPHYALPEHLDTLDRLPDAVGTHLLCPFDSLLWKRERADELFGFRYRIEIYVPQAKREFGYYVMPILHDGRLVGRLDPKLHREHGILEIKRIGYERGFRPDRRFERALTEALESLAQFVEADRIDRPPRRP